MDKVPFVPHPQKHGGDMTPCPPPKQGPWLKNRLIERFGKHLDQQTLLIRLRTYSQRPGQSIAVFVELLNRKVREIYGNEIGMQIAQWELVSILAKGLRNKVIAKKILLEYPNCYTRAMNFPIVGVV